MIILNGIQELKVLKHKESRKKKKLTKKLLTCYNNKGKSFEEN